MGHLLRHYSATLRYRCSANAPAGRFSPRRGAGIRKQPVLNHAGIGGDTSSPPSPLSDQVPLLPIRMSVPCPAAPWSPPCWTGWGGRSPHSQSSIHVTIALPGLLMGFVRSCGTPYSSLYTSLVSPASDEAWR